MLKKLLKVGLFGTVVVTTTAFIFPEQFTPITKVLNVGLAAGQIYYVYKFNENENIQQKNSRAAQYLRNALRKNGGLYLKLGQLIATLDVIVPDQYRDIMTTLTRDCQKSSYQKVKLTFQEETGLKIEDYFSDFEKQPISSASIGQVHYAKLNTGEDVAVKIQHRELSTNVQYDLKLMRFFVKLANKAFTDFKYNWLLEEFQNNIRVELDFKQEADNIKSLDELIKKQKLNKVAVPKVYPPTTQKVLIMEFISGFHIDQVEKMKEHGINIKQIGRLFSNLVIKMIHKYGFVHADPHGGNLKIRINSSGEEELVVLDHGLYQRLTKQTKQAYNKFWLGLILNDETMFDPAARQLGAKNPKILCSILTSKTQDELNDPKRRLFDLNPTQDRSKILRQAQKNQDKIVDTLNQLRRQILLLLKVNQFARTIENLLGGRPFGVYEDIANECVDSLDYSWWKRYYLYWKMYRSQ